MSDEKTPEQLEAERQAKIDKILSTKPAYVSDERWLDLHLEDDEKATGQAEPQVTEEANSNTSATPTNQPLSPEEDAHKRRYDLLKAHHDKKMNEQNQRIEALEKQLNNATKRTIQLPKTQDEINEWKKEFPDVFDTVKAIAMLEVQQVRDELAKDRENVEKLKLQTQRKEAELRLTQLHPDWVDLKHDPKFHEWANGQPKLVRDMLYENGTDPEATARAIDLYKADQGVLATKTTKPKQSSAAAVIAVETKGGSGNPTSTTQKKTWTESEIAKLKPWEYEKHEKEIDAAMREGRVKPG